MPSWLTIPAVTAAWPKFAALDSSEQSALVSAAMASVESYCRRSFELGTVTETFSGRNSPRIWLSVRPVISVSAVTINGDALDNSQGDAWVFDAGRGELVRGNGQDAARFSGWFPRGTDNVSVTYSGGYATVPGPVVRAGIIIARWLSEASRNAGLYSQERIGDYSYVLNTALGGTLPPGAAGLLAPYVQDDIA